MAVTRIRDTGDQVQIRGLKEFTREVTKLDKAHGRGLQKALTKANRQAAKMVLAETRSAASTPLQQRAARSLRVTAAASRSGIEVSKDRFEGAFGAEFGGGKHGKGNPTPKGGYTTQFPPHRGRAGYFIFPTVRRLRGGEAMYLYRAAVDDAFAAAFPD